MAVKAQGAAPAMDMAAGELAPSPAGVPVPPHQLRTGGPLPQAQGPPSRSSTSSPIEFDLYYKDEPWEGATRYVLILTGIFQIKPPGRFFRQRRGRQGRERDGVRARARYGVIIVPGGKVECCFFPVNLAGLNRRSSDELVNYYSIRRKIHGLHVHVHDIIFPEVDVRLQGRAMGTTRWSNEKDRSYYARVSSRWRLTGQMSLLQIGSSSRRPFAGLSATWRSTWSTRPARVGGQFPAPLSSKISRCHPANRRRPKEPKAFLGK